MSLADLCAKDKKKFQKGRPNSAKPFKGKGKPGIKKRFNDKDVKGKAGLMKVRRTGNMIGKKDVQEKRRPVPQRVLKVSSVCKICKLLTQISVTLRFWVFQFCGLLWNLWLTFSG